MKSVMKHNFGRTAQANIPRSAFDRSHGVKTTIFNPGQLVPIFIDEVLPGDTFNLRTSAFGRMSTPLYPLMDNQFVETFYFFVPNRLVWDNWEKFMGEKDNPDDTTDFQVPWTTSPASTGYAEHSFYDHIGIPPGIGGIGHSALPRRAYNLIWNDWFRAEFIQDSLPVSKGDGPDAPEETVVLRGKRHDYFTSCLPWPQAGDPVEIPITGNAPVISDQTGADTDLVRWWAADGADHSIQVGANGSNYTHTDPAYSGSVHPARWGRDSTGLLADMTDVTAITINQLRIAFQIQKMLERDARGGTRYTEIIRSHFGVISPDARLQRPEYLGGGSTPLNITPIYSNSDTATDVQTGRNLADIAAIGTVSIGGHGFTKSFTEHGYIIGLLCVRADVTYQQGLNRMFSRRDKLDYFWPALSTVGEQAVLNKEIYVQGENDPGGEDDGVFGYQERFAEYRSKPSEIHGRFRSKSNASLDVWHLSQEINSLPTLSDAFIWEAPPVDRVVATPDEPNYIFDIYHKLITARPMPRFGTPGNVDRF